MTRTQTIKCALASIIYRHHTKGVQLRIRQVAETVGVAAVWGGDARGLRVFNRAARAAIEDQAI